MEQIFYITDDNRKLLEAFINDICENNFIIKPIDRKDLYRMSMSENSSLDYSLPNGTSSIVKLIPASLNEIGNPVYSVGGYIKEVPYLAYIIRGILDAKSDNVYITWVTKLSNYIDSEDFISIDEKIQSCLKNIDFAMRRDNTLVGNPGFESTTEVLEKFVKLTRDKKSHNYFDVQSLKTKYELVSNIVQRSNKKKSEITR